MKTAPDFTWTEESDAHVVTCEHGSISGHITSRMRKTGGLDRLLTQVILDPMNLDENTPAELHWVEFSKALRLDTKNQGLLWKTTWMFTTNSDCKSLGMGDDHLCCLLKNIHHHLSKHKRTVLELMFPYILYNMHRTGTTAFSIQGYSWVLTDSYSVARGLKSD